MIGQTSFPRASARTQRFTLGAPRTFAVAEDATRVAFLRSRGPTDRATCLWVLDLDGPGGPLERMIADPRELASSDSAAEVLSDAERVRRERARESAGGIVSYAVDAAVATAAFTLNGALHVADLTGAAVRVLDVPTPAFDPRPNPPGDHVAYLHGPTLRVVRFDGTDDRMLAGSGEPDGVCWGAAEFIAAEEMGRTRGFWWSPEGAALIAARVDTGPVSRWHVTDPAQPARPATELAYPAAGTANARVDLAVLGLDGSRVDIAWDAQRFPYLAEVRWSEHGPPLLHVQSRDQRCTEVLAVDVATGATEVMHRQTDPHWIELVDGAPAWTPGGDLVRVADTDGARRLFVGRQMVSGTLQVRAVCGTVTSPDGTAVLFTASGDEPTEVGIYRSTPGGPVAVSTGPGVHAAGAAGRVVVLSSASLDRFGRRTTVLRDGAPVTEIASHAATPPVRPNPMMLGAGPRAIRTAVLLPDGHEPGSGALPVLCDPYGGPHAQRVLAARSAYGESQWWADQGFAVVIADGRGTPGRGPAWERAVAGDLAGPVLDDQVSALHAAAEAHPDLDLSRVAIRGWSFGGYLAALAVLRRPEVFRAGIAGAPVTDWTLYDTHYTERYLGTPQQDPQAYRRSSLLADADRLTRPLLLIHGLADDNVVAAHTLALSSALLAAGRFHSVLPLCGVTHMTPQEVVAENLLNFQLEFLRRALSGPG